MLLDCSEIDFNMLQNQKLSLINLNAKLRNPSIDGIVNFLDYVLDEAEKKNVFRYDETPEYDDNSGIENCPECNSTCKNDPTIKDHGMCLDCLHDHLPDLHEPPICDKCRGQMDLLDNDTLNPKWVCLFTDCENFHE